MKKISKVLLLLGMGSLLFSVTSCEQSGARMPKVKGKEVTFNPLELERKLERLTFKNKEDSFIDVYHQAAEHSVLEEKTYELKYTNNSVINTRNDDFWLDLDFSFSELDGKVDALVKGYESKMYTYFDIDYDNNQEFEYEWYNFDLFNGQYKIKKGMSSYGHEYNTLEDILSDFYMPILKVDMTDVEDVFYDNLILELNEIGYDKLKFYETDVLFTIELKISLADLKEGKDDVIDAIERFLYIAPDEDFLQKFEFHLVSVFERNTLIEFGLQEQVEMQQTLEPSGFVAASTLDGTIILRYTDKVPKEIKYSDYILIEDPEDIIK